MGGRDTLVITTLAQNNTLPPPAVINGQLTPQQLQQRARQDELLNSNLQEANTLQQQINDLQRRVNTPAYTYRQPAAITTVPVIIAPAPRPAYNTAFNPNYTPAYTSVTPKYKKDTVYIRDTIRIRDTADIAAREYIPLKRTDVKPNSIQIPAAQAPAVKDDINYNAMPAEVVLFDLGKTTIRPSYYNKLNRTAKLLTNNPALKAAITGYTDKTGSLKTNKILSVKRADAVKGYLVSKGVDESKLQVNSPSDPVRVKKGTGQPSNAQNRRVTVKISAE